MGSIVFTLAWPILSREYHNLERREKSKLIDKKFLFAFILFGSYAYGYLILPILIIVLIFGVIISDYKKYKMEFDEEELKRYRMDEATRLLADALRLVEKKEYKAARTSIKKIDELFDKTFD